MTTSETINYEEQEHVYPQAIDYKATLSSQQDDTERNMSMLLTFIKNIKIGTDMSQISSPVNFDAGLSALELQIEDLRPSDNILGVTQLESSEERLLRILYYLLTPLSTNPRQGMSKPSKPFNPILGEEFHCHWNHSDNSQTFAIAEQVSHHPPMTALYLYNKQHNFALEQTLKAAPMFLGNKFEITLTGPNRMHLFLPSGQVETYNITKPAMCAKGIFIGKARFEISKEMIISCDSTGLEATIKFKSDNVVKGEITQITTNKKGKNKPVPIYELDGHIVSQIHITDLRTKERKLFCDASTVEHLHKVVKPVHKQKDNESRRVWHNVTYNIRTKNMELAGKHKLEIEERQRQKAKQDKENKATHQAIHFTKTDEVCNKVHHYQYNKPITKYEAPVIQETVDDDLD